MFERHRRSFGIGEEQLLAVEFVAGDGGLALVTQYPVDKGLAFLCLDSRVFFSD
jgi:hypothetical protein